jgi:uncharacterized RDD family membrane protein YckC
MSMPQGDGPGQSWEAGSGSGPAGTPQGQPGYGQPGDEQAQYGQPQYGQQPPPAYGGGGAMQGRPISPVNEIETRVTGRRFVQYIVDAILSGVHAVLILVLVLVNIAWYFLYWAYMPYTRNGQTIGMSLMRIRVISRDGGPASLVQLFIRSILLVLFPVWSAIVGWFVMMFSRYRQRTGDHMAKTLVVRAEIEMEPAPSQYAGAGQAGTR